ncbi:MAG TPA: tetratricopeptide repeat protein [Anaerolineae bacterium]|nr:tetratricopeptide repeat protein [Anaerolineae bacterium]
MSILPFTSYIPYDRRFQMLHKQPNFPDRTTGAVLFADISGFTPLTIALAEEYGPRRGAEEVLHYINPVYEALITPLHRHGGTVIGFAGDAITCWLDGDNGHRAVATAIEMQAAVKPFQSLTTPNGTPVTLVVKLSIATGPARRFQVGNPDLYLFDAVAGTTLDRVAEGEQYCDGGNIVLDESTATNLETAVDIIEWRGGQNGANRFALIAHTLRTTQLPPLKYYPSWTEELAAQLPIEKIKPWLLPPVYDRLMAGASYLGELRPAVAIFMKFSGIDYDNDDSAGQKLDLLVQNTQEILNRYEGFLIQLTIGDKGSYLYAAFGAPLTHIDDPARALATALAIQKMMPTLPFINRFQIGVSRGLMRTGPVGANARTTYGVMGDQTNMAARFMSKAKNGQILVDGQLVTITEHLYKFTDPVEIMVKGSERPLPIAELLDSRPQILESTLFPNPLVGRDDTIQQMLAILNQTETNQGQVITVNGGTGVGKSHLTAEFSRQALQNNARVFIGSCESINQDTPYYVWRHIFTHLLALDSNKSTAKQIEYLTNTVKRVDPDLELTLPLLTDILDVDIPENKTTAALTPELRQKALVTFITTLLKHYSQRKPILIILDDTHWMDEASQKLVGALARYIQNLPIMLFLAHRELEAIEHASLLDLQNLPHIHHINLNTLSQQGLSDLITNQLQGIPTPLLLNLIRAKTDGHPLFATELVEALRDSELIWPVSHGQWDVSKTMINILHQGRFIIRQEGGWALDPRADISTLDLGVPDSVQGIVLDRIDRLPELEKLTLKVASVLGRVVLLDLLQHIHPQQIAEFEQSILNAVDHNFLYRESHDQNTFIFRHNTTQEVAYATLLYAQRKQLHQQIAYYLQQYSPHSYDQISHHAFLGEDWSSALTYAMLAGQESKNLSANQSALEHFKRALLSSHKIKTDISAQKLEIYIALGELYTAIGQYESGLEYLNQAMTAAQKQNNPTIQAKSARWLARTYELQGEYDQAIDWLNKGLTLIKSETTPEAPEMLLILSLIHARRGQIDQAVPLADQAVSLAKNLDDTAIYARSIKLVGTLQRLQGYSAEAIQKFDEALAIYQEKQDVYGQAQTYNELANAYFYMGQLAEAKEYYHQALARFSQLGDIYNSVIADNNLGGIALNQGRLDEAQLFYEAAIDGLQQIGGSAWILGMLYNNLGAVFARGQQPETARQHLATSKQYFDAIESEDTFAELYRHLAEASYAAQEYDRARQEAETALEYAQKLGIRNEEAYIQRLLGQIAAQQDDDVTARQYLERSLNSLTELGEKYELARTQLALATHLHQHQQYDQANSLLTSAHQTFQKVDAQLDLEQIKQLRQNWKGA